jgi:hypothetical protein
VHPKTARNASRVSTDAGAAYGVRGDRPASLRCLFSITSFELQDLIRRTIQKNQHIRRPSPKSPTRPQAPPKAGCRQESHHFSTKGPGHYRLPPLELCPASRHFCQGFHWRAIDDMWAELGEGTRNSPAVVPVAVSGYLRLMQPPNIH